MLHNYFGEGILSYMQKVHIVAGPTGSGKTEYAVQLARQINGELVNIDSRQIYKYLDIGTNKGRVKPATPQTISVQLKSKGVELPVFEVEDSGINIHLLSFLELDEQVNAFEFRELVYTVCDYIIGRGKTPICVGGSGLYLNVILHPERYDGYEVGKDEVKPLKRQRENDLAELDIESLQSKLRELAPEIYSGMNDSDRQNPRRLIRKIVDLEFAEHMAGPREGGNSDARPHPLGPEYSSSLIPPLKSSLFHNTVAAAASSDNSPRYDFEIHYRDIPLDELTAKLDKRVEEMFDQGLVAEVTELLRQGYSRDLEVFKGVGYKQVIEFLDADPDGGLDLPTCKQKVKTAHRQYAKRQITWFKKYLL